MHDRFYGNLGSANATIDHEESYAAAKQIERENPRWIIVFGVFTKQFVGFPRFSTAAGTVVTASTPKALSDRIKEAEGRLRREQREDSRQPW